MSSFGANRKPTFCFLLHLICIRKKISEVALKMSKLLAKFYESLPESWFYSSNEIFCRGTDISPSSKCDGLSINCLPECPSIRDAVTRGRFSFPDGILGFFVGWSSSPLAKLAVQLTSDHFLRPIVCLAGRGTRFARTHSLISQSFGQDNIFLITL